MGFARKPLVRTVEEEERSDPKFKEKLREGLVGAGFGNKAKVEDAVPPITDLVFVGVVSLVDPPRPEVYQAIKDCQSAQVQVTNDERV